MDKGLSEKEILHSGEFRKAPHTRVFPVSIQSDVAACKGDLPISFQVGDLFFQPVGVGSIIVVHSCNIGPFCLPQTAVQLLRKRERVSGTNQQDSAVFRSHMVQVTDGFW